MFTITQKGSIGPLKIGMSINDAFSILGDYTKFKRTPETEESVYAFDSDHIHLTCNSLNEIVTISVFRPESALFKGVELLGGNLVDTCTHLAKLEVLIEEAESGAWIPSHKILLVEVEGSIDGIEIG